MQRAGGRGRESADIFFSHTGAINIKFLRKIFRMIYRIASAQDWLLALRLGQFASADLTLEGFIHCSEYQQILRTAAKYYAGQKNLLLLEIDETNIAAHLKREDLRGKGENFPHVYAAIPLGAITRHFDFVETDSGFVLPF